MAEKEEKPRKKLFGELTTEDILKLPPGPGPEPKSDYEKAVRLVQWPDNGEAEQRAKDLDALLSKANFSQDQLNDLLHEAIASGGGWPTSMPGSGGINRFVDTLITKWGADVNGKGIDGDRSLHVAARKPELPLILYLLGKGANATLTNDAGKKPQDNVPGIVGKLKNFPDPKEIGKIENEFERMKMVRDYVYVYAHEKSAEVLAEAEKNPEKFKFKEQTKKEPQKPSSRIKSKDKAFGAAQNASEPNTPNPNPTNPENPQSLTSNPANIIAPIVALLGVLGLGSLSEGGLGIGSIIAAIFAAGAVAIGTQAYTKTGLFAPTTPDAAKDAAKTEAEKSKGEGKTQEPDKQSNLNMPRALEQYQSGYKPAAAPDAALVSAPPLPANLVSEKSKQV